MKKVIIGLVAKHDEIYSKRQMSVIRDEMKDAIFHNGGIAIGILSPKKEVVLVENKDVTLQTAEENLLKADKENLINQISICDGIILSGGPNTDDYEIWIAKYCYDNNIPCLAICAGQNNVVRALGGAIEKVNNPEKHARPNDEFVHPIKTVKGTFFYKIINDEKMKVNSRHQNIVKDHGILTVSAYDDDGNIEVVEDMNKTFFIGMRFHPESLYLIDDKHNRIFKEFIKCCKK